MKNNFTKEYIKECDCEEIQGLRYYKHEGDWLLKKDNKVTVNIFDNIETPDYLWLPLSHQLDEEIIKICEKTGTGYGVYWKDKFIVRWLPIEPQKGVVTVNDNPLIAKIKLLKELLKEKK